LLDDLVDEDLAAIEDEMERQTPIPQAVPEKRISKRQSLPTELPRTIIRHEPDKTRCASGCQMKRVGEDISEKLDYTPLYLNR